MFVLSCIKYYLSDQGVWRLSNTSSKRRGMSMQPVHLRSIPKFGLSLLIDVKPYWSMGLSSEAQSPNSWGHPTGKSLMISLDDCLIPRKH